MSRLDLPVDLCPLPPVVSEAVQSFPVVLACPIPQFGDRTGPTVKVGMHVLAGHNPMGGVDQP